MTSHDWPYGPQWYQKADADYDALFKGSAGTGLAERILHISESDRKRMTATITELLENQGLVDEGLGSDEQRQKVKTIIDQLMNHSDFGPMLQWARSQGEKHKYVEKAISICVHRTHNARKKRDGRRLAKPSRSPIPTTKPASSPLKAGPEPATSDPYSSPTKRETTDTVTNIKQELGRHDSEIRVSAVSLRVTQFGPSIYIPLPHTGSNTQQTAFEVLREKAREEREKSGVLEPVAGFSAPISGGDTTVLTNSAALDHYLNTRRGQITIGFEVYEGAFAQVVPDRSRSRSIRNSPASGLADFPLASKFDTTNDSNDGFKRAERAQTPIFSPSRGGRKRAFSSSPPSTVGTPKKLRSRKRNKDDSDKVLRSVEGSSPLDKKFGRPHTRHRRNEGSTFQASNDQDVDLSDGFDDLPKDVNANEDESPTDTENEQQDESSPCSTPEPRNNIDIEQYKNPPTTLRSWEEAGTAVTGIGVEEPQHGHDDLILRKDLDADSSVEEDPDGTEFPEDEEDQIDKAFRDQQEANRSEIEQQDPQILAMAAKFFKCGEERLRRHDATIGIRGMRRELRVHQAYAAFWLLWTEANGSKRTSASTQFPPSGFTYLTDTPGFGKSATAAAVVCCSRALGTAWDEVDDSRQKCDGKHLQASSESYQQSPDDECPSNETFAICCPCVEANPSSQLHPVTGINFFVVPTNLLINSVQEWYQQVDMNTNELDMRVFAQTTVAKGKNAEAVRVYMGDEKREIPMPDLLADKTLADDLKSAGLSSDLLRYVFFCTPNSWKAFVAGRDIHQVPCGRYIRDEFHQQHVITNSLLEAARSVILTRQRWKRSPGGLWQPSRESPRITLMSGTPLRLGINDLSGAMSLLGLLCLGEMPKAPVENWLSDPQKWQSDYTPYVKDDFWRRFTPSGLVNIRADWAKKSDSRAQADAQTRWQELPKATMIGRGWGARWFDDAILMRLPRMKYYRVDCEMPERLKQKTLSNVRRIVRSSDKSKSGSYTNGILCKCSTFPFLAEVAVKTDGQYNFGKNWMDTNGVLKKPKNLLTDHLTSLASSSPKIAQIRTILDTMLTRRDFAGRPAKGLIFTESNEAAYLIYMWIEQMFSKDFTHSVKSALVYGSMSKKERQKLCTEFQEGDELTVLVGVASGLGTGLTLTRALFSILVEQIGDPGTWKQIQGRMVRLSNYNWEGVVVFELLTTNWLAEQTVHERRLGRHMWAKIQERRAEAELDEAEEDVSAETDDDGEHSDTSDESQG